MKAEIRNQIIAMLYQNMDKADADDTLQLVDKYATAQQQEREELDKGWEELRGSGLDKPYTAQQPGGGEEAKDFMEKNCTEIQLGAGVGYLVTPKLLNDYARSYTPPVAEGEMVYEFLFNDNIWESSARTISIHKTRKEAEIELAFHKDQTIKSEGWENLSKDELNRKAYWNIVATQLKN